MTRLMRVLCASGSGTAAGLPSAHAWTSLMTCGVRCMLGTQSAFCQKDPKPLRRGRDVDVLTRRSPAGISPGVPP